MTESMATTSDDGDPFPGVVRTADGRLVPVSNREPVPPGVEETPQTFMPADDLEVR